MPTLSVNGQLHELDVPVGRTLAETLREELGLTGTKVACGEGHCGACTVLLDGVPVYSCITLAHMVGEREVTTIDDLAYLYLDLLDTLNLRDVVVVGVSLGGWIAAEMAVKSTERIAALVLANAVGIKPGDRETRDIADIYAVTSGADA